MRNSRYLSESEQAYIKGHSAESPQTIANKLECSVQTVYNQLHRMYGDSFLEDRQIIKNQRKTMIKEMYPTHSASEIAAILGITKSAVNNAAKRMGVKHTEETVERILRENISKSQEHDARAKKSKRLRRTIKIDKFRILSGQQPLTKRKFKQANNKELCAKHYLIRRYYYFCDKDFGETLTLFFDKETKRLLPDRERYYSKKYHIKFVHAAD